MAHVLRMFYSLIVCQCFCCSVGGKSFSEEQLDNEQQMSWPVWQMQLVLPFVACLTHLGLKMFVGQTRRTTPLAQNVLAVVPPAHSSPPAETLKVPIWE